MSSCARAPRPNGSINVPQFPQFAAITSGTDRPGETISAHKRFYYSAVGTELKNRPFESARPPLGRGMPRRRGVSAAEATSGECYAVEVLPSALSACLRKLPSRGCGLHVRESPYRLTKMTVTLDSGSRATI